MSSMPPHGCEVMILNKEALSGVIAYPFSSRINIITSEGDFDWP